jgi:hypothetical protein
MEILFPVLPLVACAKIPGWNAKVSSSVADRPFSTSLLLITVKFPGTFLMRFSAARTLFDPVTLISSLFE